MTRFLSEALEAKEPLFRHGLKKLEYSNGNPSTDIRLTCEVTNATKAKIKELGLDPEDTTAEELYEVLKQRSELDDQILVKRLRTLAATHVSAEAEPVAGMVIALNNLNHKKKCYALKLSRLKSLIKASSPKKTMKQLGYRSLDSMLKHEQPVLILAAATLYESHAWQKQLLDKYKKLKPSDFEERSINLIHPSNKRWRDIASDVVATNKHNIISFKELGTIVLLPLPADLPSGVVTASLCFSLHELNEIRACSTYLKLNQVKTDFGEIVAKIVTNEPHLSSHLLDRPVPWNIIQRYYSRLSDRFREDVFEPYVRLEDMVWHPIENALSDIEPELAFWKDTSHLGLVYKNKPVSFNVIDGALNLCNSLPFEKRVAHFFQYSLWRELLIRYLSHIPVERSIMSELQPQLVEESVLA
jgi:hypothetical protein